MQIQDTVDDQYKLSNLVLSSDLNAGDNTNPDLTIPDLAMVRTLVNEYLNTKRYRESVDGIEYYYGNNSIEKRDLFGLDASGYPTSVTPGVTQSRISHAFLRKLVDQKVNYLMGTPPVFSSPDPQFDQRLTEFWGDTYINILKNVLVDAVCCGVGWLQVYWDGEAKIRRVDPRVVIPVWADSSMDSLSAGIQVCQTRTWDSLSNRFETDKFYRWFDDQISCDVSTDGMRVNNIEPLAQLAGTPIRLPHPTLIPVKYNPQGRGLLTWVKDLIDDYDIQVSKLASVLVDDPNQIKVVQNYDGTNKDEFIRNLAKYRTIFIRDNGGVSVLDTSLKVDAIESHLDRLRQDIYEFGCGVDTQKTDLGNASGVALRFVYSDLDIDCGGFAVQIRQALQKVCDMLRLEYTRDLARLRVDYPVTIQFKTEQIRSETEQVQAATNSLGVVSRETVLEHHPFVKDVELELQRLQAEHQQDMAGLLDPLQDESTTGVSDIPGSDGG